MASYHGRAGLVMIGANQVAEITEFTLDLSAEYAETTTLNDQDRRYHAEPVRSGTGTLTCWWDNTDTNGQELLNAGENATLILRPRGTGAGLPQIAVSALVTAEGITVRRGEIVQRTIAYQVSGAVSRTTQ